MKKILFLILALLITNLFAIPQQISFQGRVTEDDGTPYHGWYDITFRLYDSEIGGILLWNETQAVSINLGYFHAFLGELTPIPEAVFDGAIAYVEIEIDSDIFFPRNTLVTVPYAFRAAVAESLIGGVALGDTLRANWAYIHDIPAGIIDGDDVGFVQLRANSGAWLTTEATLAEGTGITLDQTGSTITINADIAPDEDWQVTGDDMSAIPTGNVVIGTASPDIRNRLHVYGNGEAGEIAVFGKSSISGSEGWLGTQQYGVYGNFNALNYGYLGASGYGLYATGETHAGYFDGAVTIHGDLTLGTHNVINTSSTAKLVIASDAGSDDILHSDASGNLYWGPDEGMVDPQDDFEVPLTSLTDFTIISISSDVHGALDELDDQVNTNVTNIADNAADIATHIIDDDDLASNNEFNTGLNFVDVLDELTVTDLGGSFTTTIDNEADDLSDNVLNDLSNVNVSGAGLMEVLQFDGTNWVPAFVAGTDDQTDILVPLTSTGDFTVISGETQVHGALVDLDAQVDANATAIAADNDDDDTNELNISVSYNDGTDLLSITDNGGVLTATIDNEADDLSDNVLNDMSNVNVSGAGISEVLQFDGTNWVPAFVAGTDDQTDILVPLTSTGDFSIITGESHVHGALDDLDAQVAANATAIAADTDDDDTNELNISVAFNDGTDLLSITDNGGVLTATIDNEADDLSDNNLGDLSDVSTTGATSGQIIQFDGSSWIPGTVSADDDQNDTEVPLTSTGDFSIIAGESDVHGALDDLDAQIEANTTAIAADGDTDDTNELNISMSYNDGTDILTITDNGGAITATIDNEADDLSDNYLGDLFDVSTTGATVGQAILFDGTAWYPGTVAADDDQNDSEVPLTSTGDFSIIAGETDVHGALTDLDAEIATLSSAGYITDLQGAYDGGNAVNVAASTPVTFTATGDYNRALDLYAGNSKAIRVENASTDDDRATFHAYNASNGTAFYCSGHYRISGTSSVRTYSHAGLHFQLDRNNEPATNDSFTVRDGNDDVIFSIHEDRSADILGELNMHSNQIHNVATATATGDALPYGQAAGGDLSGSYPDPDVVAIQGRDVSATAPSTDQILRWNGTSWIPSNDGTGTDDQTFDEVYSAGDNLIDMDDGDILFRTSTAADSVLFIDDDGQVGIGNANPGNRLDITDRAGLGAIRIGEIQATDSLAGAIRYSGGHFSGYDGSDWLTFDEAEDTDWQVTDSVLYTYNAWGIARGNAGNSLYGDSAHTHVNLGYTSKTGGSTENYIYSTVSGGTNNTAQGSYSAVAGGWFNTAGNEGSFVGSGWFNNATNVYSTICGGYWNQSSGYSFVGGGQQNNIYNSFCALPGGRYCNIRGNYSFAFGLYADVPSGEHYSAVFNWDGYDGTLFVETDALSTGYQLYVNGSALAAGGTWDNSDRRLKNNIQSINNGLDMVDRLRPVSFDWNSEMDSKVMTPGSKGFIAQELRMVAPELVTVANNETGLLAVNYSGVIPINTAAIKELKLETEQSDKDLQNQIEELREENKELREMILELKETLDNNE